jgi:hypothetical protein
MGKELVLAMKEGRSHERNGAAPVPLRAHVLGLAEQDDEVEAATVARVGGERREE